jgi:thiol-disulfide isomerase/thioredoxin
MLVLQPDPPTADAVKRLVAVVLIVLVAAAGYRLTGGEGTGTGTLTLPQPAPTPGERAPLFETQEVGGDGYELSEKGVYVLTFWSTLNKDTVQARPELDRLAREYEDVRFAAVYVNSVPEDEKEAPYAVLQDGRGILASRYNVKRVPRLFLIEDGKILLVQNGFFDENREQLEDELTRIIEEKDTGRNAASGDGEERSTT